MTRTREKVQAYFMGDGAFIADKILFIKRDGRLPEYRRHLAGIREFGSVWHGITGKFEGEWITVVVAGVGPSNLGDCVYPLDRPGAICLI